MSLLSQLGVQIGDFITFPTGGVEGPRHTAQIVGPKEFPHCGMVYLAPPSPEGGNIWVYNPETDSTRDSTKRTGEEDQYGYPRWKEWPPGPEEINVESIHMGYTLFERAEGITT